MNVPAVPAPDIILVYTHQAYRALAASIAGAITPEFKAELWAKAEVNARKRKNAMTKAEQASIELSADEHLMRALRYFDENQVDILKALNGQSSNQKRKREYFNARELYRRVPAQGTALALIKAHQALEPKTDVSIQKAIVPEEKEIMTDIEDIRADHEYHQEHPTPPTVDDALVEAHEPVAIERPDGDATVGTAVVNPKNPTPDGMVAVQVAPGMIEAAQADEVRRMEDVLAELGKAKERIAALEKEIVRRDSLTKTANTAIKERDELRSQLADLVDQTAELSKAQKHIISLEQELRDAKGGTAYGDLYTAYENLRKTLTEKDKQLAALHASQQMTPLARTGGVWEAATLSWLSDLTAEMDAEITKRLNAGWNIQHMWTWQQENWQRVFITFVRQLRAAEPEPVADKPTNVRDFPVPDAELTAEGDGTVSARASGLPVSSSHGLGRGVGARRA